MNTYTNKKYQPVTVTKGTTAPAQQQKTNTEAQKTAAAPVQQKTAQKTAVQTPAPVDRTQYRYDASSDAAYMQALNALQAAQKDKPTYAGTYDAQLNEIYGQIVNRKPFTYDINSDMLYQQYRDQYVNLGRLAMDDTMGRAASLTGGYGNTYAQSVGQQQYNAYLQQLNEVVPQLYGMAQDQYNREGDALQNQFAMTGELADREYGRYQDALNSYWQNVDYLQGEADKVYDRGYNDFINAEQMAAQQDQVNYQKYLDEYDRNFQQEQWQYQQEQDAFDRKYQEQLDAWNKSFQESQFAYQKEQDSLESAWRDKEYQTQQAQIAYEKQLQAYSTLSELITATGYAPSAAELQAAGMSQAQADAYRSYYLQNSGAVSGGSGGGSGGGGGYSYTPVGDNPEGENTEYFDDNGNVLHGNPNPTYSLPLTSDNAKKMLTWYGDDSSDLVDEYTWNAQKRYATETGQHATGITKHNSYQQYLKNYLENKGYEV